MASVTNLNTAAVIAQLRAEIAAAYPTTKAFAEASGIPYVPLTRYLKGDREMPLESVLQALRALSISAAAFFERAEERAR